MELRHLFAILDFDFQDLYVTGSTRKIAQFIKTATNKWSITPAYQRIGNGAISLVTWLL